MNKVVRYLMTEKGLQVFQRIVEINSRFVEYVVVATDPHIKNDHFDDIILLAKKSKIPFFLRGSEPCLDKNLYVLAVPWRWMLAHPTEKMIIFHDSLLPKYRGFSPLVNMLINGEKKIGVTAVFGDVEYDRGAIIAQQSIEITYPIKISEAIKLNNQNYVKNF